jgi:hypothetical protein
MTRKSDTEYAFQPTEPARFPTPLPSESSGVEAAAGYAEYEPAEPPPAYGGPTDTNPDTTAADSPTEPSTDSSDDAVPTRPAMWFHRAIVGRRQPARGTHPRRVQWSAREPMRRPPHPW